MNPTVLIVEDHDTLREGLREWLSISFPGCHILEARSAKEAMDLLGTGPPDIILMDIGLSHGLSQMNGIDATRHIKATTPQVQIVMLTIHEASIYQADAAAAGANAYILQRKMHAELIPAMTKLLSRLGGQSLGPPKGDREIEDIE